MNIQLNTRARDNHGHTYSTELTVGKLGLILKINGTPGQWYLDSLRSSGLANQIYLDFGQDWLCTNIGEIMAEVRQITTTRTTDDTTAFGTQLCDPIPVGDHYHIYAVHTRFGAPSWFVTDNRLEDDFTCLPTVIRQEDTLADALRSLSC